MILEYHKPYIHDVALATLLGGSRDRRYSWTKRALKKGCFTRLRKGLYLIEKKNSIPVDAFEIAQQIYGPSYVSFESALSYHGWIPEAVYTTTNATTKRGQSMRTPIGLFSYEHTPQDQFFMAVERKETVDSIALIAHPWKALADYVYARRKRWKKLADVMKDLRLDESKVAEADCSVLEEIAQYYRSPRVQRFAKMLLKNLSQ
jgi:hypothetical protein